MNSLMRLRWYQGGRNVSSATIQRGGKITKSQIAVPGVSLGEVSTVKIDGSGWSKLMEQIVMKCAVSYLNGTRLPCQATTLKGVETASARHSDPPNFFTISYGPPSGSCAATGAWKSRGLARPLLPIGPSSGSRK